MGVAGPAGAAELTAPDAYGAYALCNVVLEITQQTGTATTNAKRSVACQTADTAPYGVHENVRVRWRMANGSWTGQRELNCRYPGEVGGGRVRCLRSDAGDATVNTYGGTPVEPLTSAASDWSCLLDRRSGSGSLTTFPCRVETVVLGSTAEASMPFDHYPGGTPGDAPRPQAGAPNYTCASKLDATGGGNYIATLTAELLNADMPPGVVDDVGYWELSWTTTTYPGRRVRVPTPDAATLSGAGWWALYHSERNLPQALAPRNDPPGTRYVIEEGSNLARYLSGERLGAAERFAGWWDINTRRFANSVAQFFGGDGAAMLDTEYQQGTVEWRKVKVECGVSADPTAPPEAQRNQVDLNQGPDAGEPATVPPQGGGAGDCFESVDFAGPANWWNPLDWGRAAWSGVVSTLNVAKAMACVLRWLLIPQSLPWSELSDAATGAFPLNLLPEVGSVWGAVGDAWDATGAEGGCFAVDLEATKADLWPAGEPAPVGAWRYSLPTPAASGCGGSFGPTRTAADDAMGELWGFRGPLRAGARVLLWLAVMYRVIRAFAPDDRVQALEVTS